MCAEFTTRPQPKRHKWMTGRSSISAYYIACLDQGPDIQQPEEIGLDWHCACTSIPAGRLAMIYPKPPRRKGTIKRKAAGISLDRKNLTQANFETKGRG